MGRESRELGCRSFAKPEPSPSSGGHFRESRASVTSSRLQVDLAGGGVRSWGRAAMWHPQPLQGMNDSRG